LSKDFLRTIHTVKIGKTLIPADESGLVQLVQVQHSPFETRDASSMQLYGFASSPLVGCDHVSVNLAGDNSNGVFIASNDQRFRPTGMASGEVQLYDNAGNSLYFKGGTLIKVVASQDIEIVANGMINITSVGNVNITAPTVQVNGNLDVTGDITDHSSGTSYSLREMRQFDANHTHTGVQEGGGRTAVSDYNTPDDGS
jgi:phage gp45-like